VILRPVHIVGAVRNAPSNYLRLARPWTLAGFDPMIQIIHEADLTRAIELALEPSVEGVFNVAGCEPAPVSHLVRLAEGEPWVVPHPLAGPILRRLWRYRLTSFPAPELDHLRYVCMVDGTQARDVLGFEAQYDLEATVAHLRLTRAD
jgi:UDP-glucose 4-epimerase